MSRASIDDRTNDCLCTHSVFAEYDADKVNDSASWILWNVVYGGDDVRHTIHGGVKVSERLCKYVLGQIQMPIMGDILYYRSRRQHQHQHQSAIAQSGSMEDVGYC
jgi:hypothetical protein